MPCGLYGKLPAKRDFIAVNMPREFLLPWETWMQGSMAASKIALTSDWLAAYQTAPLWRYWLGPGVIGLPVLGVFMSSIDGVGRHFPLTVFQCGAADDIFPTPDDPANDGWFEEVEAFLLGSLDNVSDYEAILRALEALPRPVSAPAPAADATIISAHGSLIGRSAEVAAVGEAFRGVAGESQRMRRNGASFWWTIGGEGFAPAVIEAQGMPSPHLFSAMLHGRFSAEQVMSDVA
jgi:type VI secretion system protein ImpM